MGAQARGEIHIARLVERADQLACVRYRALNGDRVFRTGSQIAGAQFVRGKKRLSASQIQHYVAMRYGAVARDAKAQGRARGGEGRGVIVDDHFKGAEAPLCVADRAAQDWEIILARRRNIARLCQEHRHVELVGQAPPGLDGGFVGAINQRHAFAHKAGEHDGGHFFSGGGDQCRDLRGGLSPLARPACRLSYVYVGNISGAACIFRHLAKQRRLYGAGDRDRASLGHGNTHAL